MAKKNEAKVEITADVKKFKDGKIDMVRILVTR